MLLRDLSCSLQGFPGGTGCCPPIALRRGHSQTWAAPQEDTGWAENQMRSLYMTLVHMDFHKDVFFLQTLRFATMCSKQKELQNQESLALSCKLLKLLLLTSQEFVFIVCVCVSCVHLLWVCAVCVCRVHWILRSGQYL